MKKNIILLLTGLLLIISFGSALAGEYVYKSVDSQGDDDLLDLDHSSAYAWGINLNNSDLFGNTLDLDNERITGVSLFFSQIHNWDNNYNILHVNLLDDTVPVASSNNIQGNVTVFYDYQSPSNYFADKYGSTLLFQWENMSTTPRNVTINITDDDGYNGALIDNVNDGATLYIPADGLTNLISYASNGIFGLGFDPDCHFYNDKILLKIYTEPDAHTNAVPEPATLMLFGAGLMFCASKLRKKG